MNFSLSLDLLIYGAMLIGFSVFTHRQVPDVGATTLIAALVGGVLSVFWGGLGLAGFRGRAGAIVTMADLAAVLFALAVKAWIAVNAGVQTLKLVALILTLLPIFAIGQLTNLRQAGHRSPANSETKATGSASERDSHPTKCSTNESEWIPLHLRLGPSGNPSLAGAACLEAGGNSHDQRE